jgi:hypothetical protein
MSPNCAASAAFEEQFGDLDMPHEDGQAHRRMVVGIDRVYFGSAVEQFFDHGLVAFGRGHVQGGVFVARPPAGDGTSGRDQRGVCCE